MFHNVTRLARSGPRVPGSLRTWLLALAAVALCTPSASAVSFSTSGTLNSLPVSATANFTLGTNQVTIDISGLVSNPTSVIQALSGISFSLSGTQTGGAASGTAQQVNVTGNGAGQFNFGGTTSSTAIPFSLAHGWTPTFGSTINLTMLGDGTQDYQILGGPGAGPAYSNANASILGDNPFLNQTAHFVLTFASGVTSSTTVSNVVFQFGTGPTTLAAVPEPATATIAGIGMASMGLFGVFRRRNRSAAVS